MIVELCEDVVASGFELKGHWIVLYFLRKAMLIMILASIQAQNAHNISKEDIEYVSMAASLLDGADNYPARGRGMDVIRAFLNSLEYGSKP